MPDKFASFTNTLAELKGKNLYRELKTVKRTSSNKILINGKECINFSSNDYLGLSDNQRIKEKIILFLEKYGPGAASSRLLSGTLEIHKELEQSLAEFKKSESALVFPSGYQANVSVMSSLVSEGDCVILDRLNHASIVDGAKLSKAKILIYRHRDINDLEKVLKLSQKYNKKLVVTDAVFSMDGDIAPLKEISYLAEKYSSMLMADEAHSTGIFGKTGAGIAEHLGVEDKIDIKMGTLSKAIGSQGGFVCLSEDLKNYIVNKARGFIYTTALSPVCAAAALESIRIIREPSSSALRENLLILAAYATEKLKASGYNLLDCQSQIIPVLIGDIDKSIKISEHMFGNGFYIPSIKYPTVSKDMARLRISLTTKHRQDDIDKLCKALSECTSKN